MGDAAEIVSLRRKAAAGTTSQELALQSASNELLFAVVGHVGSGTSTVAELLRDVLSRDDSGRPYDVSIIKAREVLTEWAARQGLDAPSSENEDLNRTRWLQDVGDTLRRETNDHSAVARRLVLKIRETRARRLGVDLDGGPVEPDGQPRAYVLDSIRHPAEVQLLQHIYGAAFVLVGIVCDEDERRRRITDKYRNAGGADATRFMERDAKAKEPYGQRVAEAFHLADFFVDNTEDRTSAGWTVPDNLSRLKKIVTRAAVVRPLPGESGMYAAHGAMMRSACLSRQVGAALVDGAGAIVATGANEAPRAGGGTYADIEPDDKSNYRCAAWKGYCRNTREQTEIIEELYVLLNRPMEEAAFNEILRSSRIGGLLEFSRAVHAEMEALLDAGRRGVRTVGTTAYVTTFPCHYCARHLVGAGVKEVQYIEPYPKSRALTLHEDAITTSAPKWKPGAGGNVLFRAFTGVAPRLFVRAFVKDRDLKDRTGNLSIAEPSWATPWHLGRISYAQLEAELGRDV